MNRAPGMQSGHFGANSTWVLCAAIAHNLKRAAGVLTSGAHAVARGAALRRKLVAVPARLVRPQRRPILHLPTHWPWSDHWLALWRNTIGYSPPPSATNLTTPPNRPDHRPQEKLGGDQRLQPAHDNRTRQKPDPNTSTGSIHGPNGRCRSGLYGRNDDCG